MLFSSLVFLFCFLPATLLSHSLLKQNWLRNLSLLCLSLLFYFWGEGYLVAILILSSTGNYLAAILIDRLESRARWIALAVSVSANVLVLSFYKYSGFLVENLIVVFPSSREFLDVQLPELPIGISFFTFQAISYLVDVYRREVAASKNLTTVALYISLFPQLIAGPIVRYATISNQIVRRTLSVKTFTRGLQRFLEGLSKKILIADPLAVIVDSVFQIPPAEISTSLSWFVALCYAMQIYFDFSGYSDMAIGLGRMLGFRFLENFRHPYAADSMQDFWRRWHISLSTWFRDYLYFPLGGNRKSPLRTTFNLFLVFSTCGLWHGASWTFLVWGLMHGAALSLERVQRKKVKKISKIVRHLYVALFTLFSWVMFRSESISEAFSFWSKMLGLQSGAVDLSSPTTVLHTINEFSSFKIVSILLIAVFCSSYSAFLPKLQTSYLRFARSSQAFQMALGLTYVFLFLLCIIQIVNGSYSPFIYFRF